MNKILEFYGVCLTSSPAAADTIYSHLGATGTDPDDYDHIITGDLAMVGSEILYELLQKQGIDISKKHLDCGSLIFDAENQKVNAGGSGCGCIASVFSGYISKKLRSGEMKKILLVATGALMSPSSVLLGESISGIAHAAEIMRVGE